MYRKQFAGLLICGVMISLTLYTSPGQYKRWMPVNFTVNLARATNPNNDTSAEHHPANESKYASENATAQAKWTSTTTATTYHLTVPFLGRLGNQLFQYATLVGLARANGRKPSVNHGSDVANLFQISHVNKDIGSSGWRTITEREYATFDPSFMKLPKENLILSGYLQCWRYFQHAQDEIRRELTLVSSLQNQVTAALTQFRNEFENNVLVGVHIRRGDFLTEYNSKLGYGVASESYFRKAFSKVRSLLPNQNITFLVGSDDLDWCKNNLKDSMVRYLPPGSAFEHFAILSSCDHVILTGGTFGWWIGWLANGITVYYTKFVTENSLIHKGFNPGDYYPPGWIGLDN